MKHKRPTLSKKYKTKRKKQKTKRQKTKRKTSLNRKLRQSAVVGGSHHKTYIKKKNKKTKRTKSRKHGGRSTNQTDKTIIEEHKKMKEKGLFTYDPDGMIKVNCAAKKEVSSDTASCYNSSQILRLRNAWNDYYAKKNPNEKINENNPRKVREILAKKLMNQCKSDGCWLKLPFAQKAGIKLEDVFAPLMPDSWENNIIEWLTDRDIRKVMKQFEKVYPDFVFLGPAPIDFNKKIKVGNSKTKACVNDELCDFSLKKLEKMGKTKVGIIVNTDEHTRGGSHWKSIFIKNEEKSIRITKYDSNAGPQENEIRQLIHRIKSDYPHKSVHTLTNHSPDQFGSSECGMFAISFLFDMLSHGSRTPISDLYANLNRHLFFNNPLPFQPS